MRVKSRWGKDKDYESKIANIGLLLRVAAKLLTKSPFCIKNIGHITVQKHVNDVSNFFIVDFMQNEDFSDS